MINDLGPYQSQVDATLERWLKEEMPRRLRERDPTLWFPQRVPEITDRLGWLFLKASMRPHLDGFVDLAQRVAAEGITDVVLLGMGGSSLAPEVFQRTFGNRGHPSLTVLDSTHPSAVLRVRRGLDPRKTLFIVSSKSGTTLETLSLFRYFWNELRDLEAERGQHFIAITDHGSPLAELAAKRGFRRVIEATPDVGGRYSALTAFGLVPAAVIGVDVHLLLDKLPEPEGSGATGASHGYADGLALGATLGELTRSGRNKITILASPTIHSFPMWIEQLLAESTGKDGKGMIPVIDEPPLGADGYSSDRLFIGLTVRGEDAEISDRLEELAGAGHPTVHMSLEDRMELGLLMFEWELAVASAATVMGVHPFNQPDVQMTKDLTNRMMAADGTEKITATGVETCHIDHTERVRRAVHEWSSRARPGDYVSIQAYLAPEPATTNELREMRCRLLGDLDIATTLDYGPRFLHSTGQLHKGGPNTGLFLQLVDEPEEDLPVPEKDYTFGQLIRAASLGDYMALKQEGRRTLRICLGKAGAENLPMLRALLDARVTMVEEARS